MATRIRRDIIAKRKPYSASFKSKVALEAINGDMTIAELTSKYGINPVMVTKWKKQAIDGMADTFSKRGQASGDASHEARIKELHAKIGELTVDAIFYPRPSDAEPRPEDGHDRPQSHMA